MWKRRLAKAGIVVWLWPLIFVMLSYCGVPLVLAIGYLSARLGAGNASTVADYSVGLVDLASAYAAYRICRVIWPTRQSFEASPASDA